MFVLALLRRGARDGARTVEVGPNGSMTFRDEESHNSTSTINVGDTINWTVDGFHSTTSRNLQRQDARRTATGTRASRHPGFRSPHVHTAGTFPYYCLVHGVAMSGTVVVQRAPGPPAANFTFRRRGRPSWARP